MSRTLSISPRHNRRHATTGSLLCFECRSRQIDKWIKREQRMDSTCKKTVTSSSVLGSFSPSYFIGPQSFLLDIFLKAKMTTVQKFLSQWTKLNGVLAKESTLSLPSRKTVLQSSVVRSQEPNGHFCISTLWPLADKRNHLTEFEVRPQIKALQQRTKEQW